MPHGRCRQGKCPGPLRRKPWARAYWNEMNFSSSWHPDGVPRIVATGGAQRNPWKANPLPPFSSSFGAPDGAIEPTISGAPLGLEIKRGERDVSLLSTGFASGRQAAAPLHPWLHPIAPLAVGDNHALVIVAARSTRGYTPSPRWGDQRKNGLHQSGALRRPPPRRAGCGTRGHCRFVFAVIPSVVEGSRREAVWGCPGEANDSQRDLPAGRQVSRLSRLGGLARNDSAGRAFCLTPNAESQFPNPAVFLMLIPLLTIPYRCHHRICMREIH
jgi:hypothetical protein